MLIFIIITAVSTWRHTYLQYGCASQTLNLQSQNACGEMKRFYGMDWYLRRYISTFKGYYDPELPHKMFCSNPAHFPHFILWTHFLLPTCCKFNLFFFVWPNNIIPVIIQLIQKPFSEFYTSLTYAYTLPCKCLRLY